MKPKVPRTRAKNKVPVVALDKANLTVGGVSEADLTASKKELEKAKLRSWLLVAVETKINDLKEESRRLCYRRKTKKDLAAEVDGN